MDATVQAKTVASLFGVTPRALIYWAKKGYGPPRVKIGPRRVGYRVEDVERFMADRPTAPRPSGS